MLTFLTRAGCHLCEDARAVVQRVATQTGVPWVERDVDEDDALRTAYSDFVPVVLVADRVVGYWRIDEAALRTAVQDHGQLSTR